MAEVTVKQLASVVGTPVERLLEQIKDAGLAIDAPDSLISDADKMALLGFLRGQHGKDSSVDAGSKPHKIALKRKSVSEVKVRGSGRGSVSIEVRRKRSITRPVVEETQAETAEIAEQEIPVEIKWISPAEKIVWSTVAMTRYLERQVTAYSFKNMEEMIPGTWNVKFYHENKLIGEQDLVTGTTKVLKTQPEGKKRKASLYIR